MGIPFKGKVEVSFSSYHFIISNGNSVEKGKYHFFYTILLYHMEIPEDSRVEIPFLMVMYTSLLYYYTRNKTL